MMRRIKSQNGFTLIEFGAAIAIVGVLGVSVNQIARFNLLFLPAVQFGQAPAQCTVDLKIFDNTGGTVASSTVTLLPNQSRNLVFENSP
ncbi:MAG: type II secretion system protein, partial [Deltaproteobacteria bacterium]|nr:type II secretion system protein [Deltaproteobacteria bacterium]